MKNHILVVAIASLFTVPVYAQPVAPPTVSESTANSKGAGFNLADPSSGAYSVQHNRDFSQSDTKNNSFGQGGNGSAPTAAGRGANGQGGSAGLGGQSARNLGLGSPDVSSSGVLGKAGEIAGVAGPLIGATGVLGEKSGNISILLGSAAGASGSCTDGLTVACGVDVAGIAASAYALANPNDAKAQSIARGVAGVVALENSGAITKLTGIEKNRKIGESEEEYLARQDSLRANAAQSLQNMLANAEAQGLRTFRTPDSNGNSTLLTQIKGESDRAFEARINAEMQNTFVSSAKNTSNLTKDGQQAAANPEKVLRTGRTASDTVAMNPNNYGDSVPLPTGYVYPVVQKSGNAPSGNIKRNTARTASRSTGIDPNGAYIAKTSIEGTTIPTGVIQDPNAPEKLSYGQSLNSLLSTQKQIIDAKAAGNNTRAEFFEKNVLPAVQGNMTNADVMYRASGYEQY